MSDAVDTDMNLVMDGYLRTITPSKAQELKKKGVNVRWSEELGCYVLPSDTSVGYSHFARRGWSDE